MGRDIRKDPGILTKPAGKAPAKPANDSPGPVNATPQPKRPIEAHLAEAKLSRPLTAALMALTKWGQGQKLTEQEFAAALEKLRTLPACEV